MKSLVVLIILCFLSVVSYAQDISSLQLRAEQGDASAQFALCRYYVIGQGVEADDAMALGYLMQAAENDYPEALYELGCCYKDGALGLPVWEEKAKQYIFRAHELGYDGVKEKLEEMTEEYEKQAKGVRRAVYNQTILVAPREQYFKYSENKKRLIRQ